MFGSTFSKYQCGFNKDFNTQNALLFMVEKMLLAHDKTDLSKAFDCISYDLLIAEFNVNGLIDMC